MESTALLKKPILLLAPLCFPRLLLLPLLTFISTSEIGAGLTNKSSARARVSRPFGGPVRISKRVTFHQGSSAYLPSASLQRETSTIRPFLNTLILRLRYRWVVSGHRNAASTLACLQDFLAK